MYQKVAVPGDLMDRKHFFHAKGMFSEGLHVRAVMVAHAFGGLPWPVSSDRSLVTTAPAR